VQLKGADRRAILNRQSELAVPPSPGSIIVSNENEQWVAVQPQIAAGDVNLDGLAIRLMIAAGAGVPLFWLAEAEHTARGTAAEMAAPTYAHFRQRQLYFGWLMRSLAVDALRRRGLVDVVVDDVEAEFPELVPSQSLSVASALAQLTQSLVTAKEQGWVTEEDAAQVYQHFLGEAVNLPGSVVSVGERGGKGSGPRGGSGPRSARKGRERGTKGVPAVLDPNDPRAGEQLPPEFSGGGLVVPEPVVRI
jgi:hypothetical protein